MMSTMTKVLPVQFISCWNEGEVQTPAKLNLETGEVFDIEKSEEADNFQGLSGEYVATPNSELIVPVTTGADDTVCIVDSNDLASIRSSAVRVEGGWLLTGSKVWTRASTRATVATSLPSRSATDSTLSRR